MYHADVTDGGEKGHQQSDHPVELINTPPLSELACYDCGEETCDNHVDESESD